MACAIETMKSPDLQSCIIPWGLYRNSSDFTKVATDPLLNLPFSVIDLSALLSLSLWIKSINDDILRAIKHCVPHISIIWKSPNSSTSTCQCTHCVILFRSMYLMQLFLASTTKTAVYLSSVMWWNKAFWILLLSLNPWLVPSPVMSVMYQL